MTAVLAAAAVMAAAFVKGSIGFGFPVLGTPLRHVHLRASLATTGWRGVERLWNVMKKGLLAGDTLR